MINVGDTVTWKSQASGYEATKTGKVIAIVPHGGRFRGYLAADISRSRLMFDGFTAFHDRYLIEVQREGKGGRPLAPIYYAPFRSVIDRQVFAAKREKFGEVYRGR